MWRRGREGVCVCELLGYRLCTIPSPLRHVQGPEGDSAVHYQSHSWVSPHLAHSSSYGVYTACIEAAQVLLDAILNILNVKPACRQLHVCKYTYTCVANIYYACMYMLSVYT